MKWLLNFIIIPTLMTYWLTANIFLCFVGSGAYWFLVEANSLLHNKTLAPRLNWLIERTYYNAIIIGTYQTIISIACIVYGYYWLGIGILFLPTLLAMIIVKIFER